MIIWRDQPLTNDHLKNPAFCKWSSGDQPLTMFIRRIWPLAKSPAISKWSSEGSGLLQMIIRYPHHHCHLCQDPGSISRTFLEQFGLVWPFYLGCSLLLHYECSTPTSQEPSLTSAALYWLITNKYQPSLSYTDTASSPRNAQLSQMDLVWQNFGWQRGWLSLRV